MDLRKNTKSALAMTVEAVKMAIEIGAYVIQMQHRPGAQNAKDIDQHTRVGGHSAVCCVDEDAFGKINCVRLADVRHQCLGQR